MKSSVLPQVGDRIRRCREAVSAIENAEDYQASLRAWIDFLTAANTVYSKLEQGAKGCGKSEAWYGRKKHERKKDPLLAYIHQARNADEHGVSPISSVHPGGAVIRGEGAYKIDGGVVTSTTNFNVVFEQDGPRLEVTGNTDFGLSLVHESGPPPEVEILRPQVLLIPIRDERFNTVFFPPSSHLGKPVEPLARIVASLGLTYLEGLLKEAYSLPNRL